MKKDFSISKVTGDLWGFNASAFNRNGVAVELCWSSMTLLRVSKYQIFMHACRDVCSMQSAETCANRIFRLRYYYKDICMSQSRESWMKNSWRKKNEGSSRVGFKEKRFHLFPNIFQPFESCSLNWSDYFLLDLCWEVLNSLSDCIVVENTLTFFLRVVK